MMPINHEVQIRIVGIDQAVEKLMDLALKAQDLAIGIERTRISNALLRCYVPARLAQWIVNKIPRKWLSKIATRRMFRYLTKRRFP